MLSIFDLDGEKIENFPSQNLIQKESRLRIIILPFRVVMSR